MNLRFSQEKSKEVTMSNNKQIEKPLELPHQETIVGINTIQTKPFDNQKIEIMTNNKQSMKLYTEEQLKQAIKMALHGFGIGGIEDTIEVVASKLTPIELPSDDEKSKFTIDYFNWLHTNQYKYNPKVKMYQKMMINETLFFTIEELMIEFNKIQGGNK